MISMVKIVLTHSNKQNTSKNKCSTSLTKSTVYFDEVGAFRGRNTYRNFIIPTLIKRFEATSRVHAVSHSRAVSIFYKSVLFSGWNLGNFSAISHRHVCNV